MVSVELRFIKECIIISSFNETVDTRALFISIVGKPNAGKSSLLNMMIDYKASIVSPKPQTTRDIISGILTEGNVQIVFVDTPGIHKTNTLLGKCMCEKIRSSFISADACLHVVEAGKPMSVVDNNIISTLKSKNLPSILAINKIDKLKNKNIIINQINSFIGEYGYSAVVPLSAKTGYGKTALMKEIKNLSVPSQFFFPEDQPTDQNERKIVSEIIREKALRFLNQEVPHGVGVFIESMSIGKNNFISIEATLYCSNERHKKIIIGKSGSMLKKIGSFARQDIESMLGSKTNLKIWVKVKNDWQNEEKMLELFNYK